MLSPALPPTSFAKDLIAHLQRIGRAYGNLGCLAIAKEVDDRGGEDQPQHLISKPEVPVREPRARVSGVAAGP
jgi:hypothetical protein